MRNIKLIGILVLAIALGALIVQNRDPVQIHFLAVTVEMPHILLLILIAGVGFALGLLVALFNGSRPKERKK